MCKPMGQPITPLTPQEQAFLYPYDAPSGAYLMSEGQVQPLDDYRCLEGRVAVLSVGSNRAPRQLLRKFGPQAMVPVTPAILHDCDICHVANIAPYGAVPCAAFVSPGTSVQLNIAWLDTAQLEIMHATESLGTAYDFVRWRPGQITHQCDDAITGKGTALAQPVYGYSSRLGPLPNAQNQPMALAKIPAESRRFHTATQEQAMQRLQALSAMDEDMALTGWIAQLQGSEQRQEKIRHIAASHALSDPALTGAGAYFDIMDDLLV